MQGITDAAGSAPALVRPVPTTTAHVWTGPHRCGPFPVLEGAAGGRRAYGAARLCDHADGA